MDNLLSDPTPHGALATDDDGSWSCSACSRQGGPYTLASRQPCSIPSSEDMPVIAAREAIEEALVSTGCSSREVTLVLNSQELDSWLKGSVIPIQKISVRSLTRTTEGKELMRHIINSFGDRRVLPDVPK